MTLTAESLEELKILINECDREQLGEAGFKVLQEVLYMGREKEQRLWREEQEDLVITAVAKALKEDSRVQEAITLVIEQNPYIQGINTTINILQHQLMELKK